MGNIAGRGRDSYINTLEYSLTKLNFKISLSLDDIPILQCYNIMQCAYMSWFKGTQHEDPKLAVSFLTCRQLYAMTTDCVDHIMWENNQTMTNAGQ